MGNTWKIVMLGLTSALMLNGCFSAGQIRDKLYEDCYTHPDNVRALPQAEQQALAKKCGWKQQESRQSKSLLNQERLCLETVSAPSVQNQKSGQKTQKLPNGMTLKYNIVNGQVPELNVFYPNGKTETHTRFKNGKAEGWSEGYYPSGKVRTRFFYQNGKAQKYEVYNENGQIAEQGKVSCR